jgi:hypothetical protein
MHHFGCAAIVTRNAGGSHILGLGEMLLELQKFRMINRGLCFRRVLLSQLIEGRAFNAVLMKGCHDQTGHESQ